MSDFILALDQGTTSSRSILFDHSGNPVAQASREFKQIYPQPGWVEHDPLEIWQSQLDTAREVIEQASISAAQIAAIGITNQRETTILWDRKTGKPVYNAIVWQCRRTAEICEKLKQRGLEPLFQQKTGLIIDAYFSATKIKWLLDEVPNLRDRANNGEICFGTVDSWLIYNLTDGSTHATDYSNVSRTQLFNIHDKKWDREILELLEIPESMLPQVRQSSTLFGKLAPRILGAPIPISGVAGDQQAALFGQGCFDKGTVKNTYGTGCFLVMNTADKAITSNNGLLTSLAWGVGEKVDYALEGSVFIAGAAIQWLRDEMQLISTAAESEQIANQIEDTEGVYFVPSFTGLGAPYWDMYARGTISGLTRGTGRAHIVRAALEAIAFQTRDVLMAMESDSGIRISQLKVDGGAVSNGFLMQFQADILGIPVVVCEVSETTALGTAYLAGLASGFWKDLTEISSHWKAGKTYQPAMDSEEATARYKGWKIAVERSRLQA